MMGNCAWGSSADAGSSNIVVEKCEATFLKQLSPAAKTRYVQEAEICWKTEELHMGTMYISFAALCAVDVAKEYATNPARRADAPLQASFDCKKAASPLERAICSDQELGEEDVILSRIYNRTSNALKTMQYDSVLRDDQRVWLKQLPDVCQLSDPLTTKALECLRKEVQVRYSLIDGCSEEGPGNKEVYVTCLHDTSMLRGFDGN